MGTQSVTLTVLVLATVVVGLVWRSRQGTVRPARGGVDWAGWSREAGVERGPRATFVQLSAAVCSPCRATARVLSALAAAERGVVHVELDVEHHPGLVAAARVLRTPTVVVLDGAGTEVARSSGAMTPAQARAALAAVGQDAARTVDEGRRA